MLCLQDLKEVLSCKFTLTGDIDNQDQRLEAVTFDDEVVNPYLEYQVIDIFNHWWQPDWDSFETELVIDIRKPQ